MKLAGKNRTQSSFAVGNFKKVSKKQGILEKRDTKRILQSKKGSTFWILTQHLFPLKMRIVAVI